MGDRAVVLTNISIILICNFGKLLNKKNIIQTNQKNYNVNNLKRNRNKPPTTPAVYRAALRINGPPIRHKGATTAPIIPLWTIQATCLPPKPPV